ncbi:MAG: hypothetical protein OXN83_03960, partial [Oligoflexia bacterium]|nr:hypothetical protein [Oligoflexia bacterium]
MSGFRFLKRSVIFIIYFMTAMSACLFSLLLVLNFLNPALSQEPLGAQKKEQSSFKEIMGNISQSLTAILKDMVKSSTSDTNQDSDSEKPSSNTSQEESDKPAVSEPLELLPEAPPAPDNLPEAPPVPDNLSEAP